MNWKDITMLLQNVNTDYSFFWNFKNLLLYYVNVILFFRLQMDKKQQQCNVKVHEDREKDFPVSSLQKNTVSYIWRIVLAQGGEQAGIPADQPFCELTRVG